MREKNRRLRRVVLLAIGAVVLAAGMYGCAGGAKEAVPAAVEEPDLKQLVDGYSTGRLTADSASITSQELIVKDGGATKTYTLPEDEFFVSIAPYVEATHPCEIHSLTGCRGELTDATFDVRIEASNGRVIVDGPLRSYANGFLDLWLPRDETYRVTITQDGRSAEAAISTFAGDGTCITTMQLLPV